LTRYIWVTNVRPEVLLRAALFGVFVASLLIVGALAALGSVPTRATTLEATPVLSQSAYLRSTSAVPIHPLDTYVLSAAGIDPTVVSLTWNESTDFDFENYSLAYAYSYSGPFYTLGVLTSSTENYDWVYGLSPGDTWYWQVTEYNCFILCGAGGTSNVLETTQPAVASLGYTNPTSTSAQLTWNNHAQYGGNLSFGSYQVMESISGGAYSAATSITSASTHSYTVNGLSTGTGYSFYINTTDVASGFGSTDDYSTDSNTITFGTAVALSASATAHPSSVDVTQRVSFSCAAAGGESPYTYTWAFGDGGTGSGATTSHTYTTAGNYTATCTITDSDSTTAASGVSMTVTPLPTVVASVNYADASPGYSLTFTATPGGGSGSYVSYSWAFGDGATSSGSSVSHAYTRVGEFNATVTVTDSNGGTAVGTAVIFIQNLTITAGVSKTAIVPGASITFSASATGGAGSPYTFSWAFGDGTTGAGASVTHAYTTAGNFTPRVTVTDAVGSTNSTALAVIEVFSPLTVLIGLSSSRPTPGSAVTLTADVGGGTGTHTCKWEFGDSNAATGCSVAHSWATTGTYTVNLTVSDPAAGNVSSTTTVTVISPSSTSSLAALGPSVGGFPILLLVLIIVVIAAVAVLLTRRRKPASPSTVICPKCGATNGAGAVFCQKCAAPLTGKPSATEPPAGST
jgi:PKD repeat protein